MPRPAPTSQPANKQRIRHLVFPREHGAWGILLIPLFTGAAAALHGSRGLVDLALFILAALALFCLRTPVETLMQTTAGKASTDAELGAVYIAIAIYLAVASLALGLLLIWKGNYNLLPLGGVVCVIFLIQAGVRKLGRENRMVGQLIGSAGLTSTAAAAYYVVSGRLDSLAWILWGLNWLFAANQIHYVQIRILSAQAKSKHEKFLEGKFFLAGEVVTLLLLAAAWKFSAIHATYYLAFLPAFYRGTAWFFKRPAPLRIHQLGRSELTQAIAFGVLLIMAIYLPPL